MELLIVMRIIIAIVIALALAIHGKSRKSLDTSGCIAAIFVGFAAFAASYRFGILLILFYLSSSKFTKLKEDVKAKLEDGYSQGGQRNWYVHSIELTVHKALAYFLASSGFKFLRTQS